MLAFCENFITFILQHLILCGVWVMHRWIFVFIFRLKSTAANLTSWGTGKKFNKFLHEKCRKNNDVAVIVTQIDNFLLQLMQIMSHREIHSFFVQQQQTSKLLFICCFRFGPHFTFHAWKDFYLQEIFRNYCFVIYASCEWSKILIRFYCEIISVFRYLDATIVHDYFE